MRVKVHPSFVLYLLCTAALSSYTDCIGMLAALLVHELCHYAAARLTGEQIARLELTPFGGVMRYKQGVVPSKGIKGVIVHAAGPMGNYALLLAAGMPAVQQMVLPELLHSLIMANASMLILNLLPALPLDGGQIVFCLGYYLFPIVRLADCLSFLGIAAGTFGIFLSLYGLLAARLLNCSLLIVSLYLIIIAYQSRRMLLTENIYAVIQERLTNIPRLRRIEHYHAAPDTALFEFIPLLKPDVGVAISFSEGFQTRELTEVAFCQGLISMPSASIRETWLYFSQYKEKKHSNP